MALPGAVVAVAATATLLTAAGQSVYCQALQLSDTPQALPGLPNLPAGLYVLRLTTAAGVITQKVVRQ